MTFNNIRYHKYILQAVSESILQERQQELSVFNAVESCEQTVRRRDPSAASWTSGARIKFENMTKVSHTV